MGTILSTTPEVEQLTTAINDFSIHEPSILEPSRSPVKRTQSDSCFSSKQSHLLESVEQNDLTPFFWFHAILPSQVPSTLEEFFYHRD